MAEKISFYDVKAKEKFETDDYELREKNGRFFAVAKSKSGPHECWRVLSKDQAQKMKSEGMTIKKVPAKKAA